MLCISFYYNYLFIIFYNIVLIYYSELYKQYKYLDREDMK